MAVSNTSIANRALQLLGARRIESLAEDSTNAKAMNAAFEPLRKALLRKHQWNFATKRASIAADSTETLYEGLNRFRLPDDFLALRRRQTTATRTDRQDWQIEGNFIVTSDSAPLEIRYTYDVTDPAQFDSLFTELLAVELALAVVDTITGSNVKRQTLVFFRDDLLFSARKANAFESDPGEPPEDDWVKSMR